MSAPVGYDAEASARAHISLPRPRGKLRRCWLVLAALTLAAGPAAAAPFAVAVQSDIAYGPLPAERGDLFLPVDAAGLRGAVLLIHGGGWVGGSRASLAGFGAMLAARGLVVFAIDYRLGDQARPDTRWPAQLVDAQLAVRWLRAQAATLHIDPDRIAAMGDSAGGQLAVMLGVLPRIVAGDQAQRLAAQKPGVAAVVDAFGLVDLSALGTDGRGTVTALFGTPAPPAAALDTMSPLAAVTRQTAPMLIVHGTADAVVPFAQSQRLYQALRAHGVPVELVSYPGGHEYIGLAEMPLAALLNQEADWILARLGRP